MLPIEALKEILESNDQIPAIRISINKPATTQDQQTY